MNQDSAITTVALATGDSSPLKTFEIDGLDDAMIRERLGGKAPPSEGNCQGVGFR